MIASQVQSSFGLPKYDKEKASKFEILCLIIFILKLKFIKK